MKKIIYLLTFIFLQQITIAQINEDSIFIKKIYDYELNNGSAYNNLRYLCKQIGNRVSGSNAMYKAEEWGLQTIQNAKPDKAFVQECLVPHWVRGNKEKASYKWISAKANTLQTAEKNIEVLALGNSIGSNDKPITAEMVLVNNFDEFNTQKDNVKGKIVFFNYPFNQTLIRTFMGYGDAVRYRSSGASLAAKYGAVGALVRSVSTSPDNNPHTGALHYNDSFPKIPAFAVGVQDADNMAQLYKNGKLNITMQNNANFLPDTLAHNIIGELTGSEFPNEYITVGGHLDSWDIGEGAHDDGSGIVQSIDVLNILKTLGFKPKHTIRIILYANEENGTRGGMKYAELSEKNKEKHIAAIETDAGGFSPRSFAGTMNDEQYKKFASWQSLFFNYGIYEMGRGGGGSDIEYMNEKFKTPVIELMPDSQRYFDLHHSKNDVFEAVSKRELHLGAASLASLIYLLDKYGL